MINWESRSQYLLTEIVKYEKYIESLRSAMKERLRRRGEKALEKALLSSNLGNNSRGFGFADEETIHEGQETDTEPPTPAAKQVQFQRKRDATEVTS
jgi:PH/SEC7 domain-containing protein